MLITIL